VSGSDAQTEPNRMFIFHSQQDVGVWNRLSTGA